jgi:tRNA-dihydrouridine synthase B
MNEISREFHVGSIRVWPNVILSPMHGVTDQAFRLLCKRLAGGKLGLLVSEFVAVEGVAVGNPRELALMDHCEEERPFCVQIFGSEPSLMARAAREARKRGADLVEINAGCPAPKVVRRGGGSGLLQDLPRLGRILAECRKSLPDIPLSLKSRIGWCDDTRNVLDTLRVAESEGVDLYIVHGRTRLQGYKGLADWEEIAQVKAEAKIPIVGNGDLKTVADVENALRMTGVDGVSVGRGAMHNPWIFAQIAACWEGREWTPPTGLDLISLLAEYRSLLSDPHGSLRALGRLKQISARVTKSFDGLSDLRTSLLRSASEDEFQQHLLGFEQGIRCGAVTCVFNPARLQSLNGKNTDELESGCDYKR